MICCDRWAVNFLFCTNKIQVVLIATHFLIVVIESCKPVTLNWWFNILNLVDQFRCSQFLFWSLSFLKKKRLRLLLTYLTNCIASPVKSVLLLTCDAPPPVILSCCSSWLLLLHCIYLGSSVQWSSLKVKETKTKQNNNKKIKKEKVQVNESRSCHMCVAR